MQTSVCNGAEPRRGAASQRGNHEIALLTQNLQKQLKNLTTGIIFDIKKFSIHDGPGIRTTVFFKGCPLRCWWCHNPESQSQRPERIFLNTRCIRCGACLDVCEQEAIRWNGNGPVTDTSRCTGCGACVDACYADARQLIGQTMSVTQVMEEISKDRPFYDESGGGVTFSGGEPLCQPKFLRALLRASQEAGIYTALDTCGFASWEALDTIRGDVDLFLYDLKHLDDAKHRCVTGVSNHKILTNLRKLSACGHRIFLRVPLIPGINDDDNHIRQIGTFAASLPHLERVDLLPYHQIAEDKYSRLGKTYTLTKTRELPPERIRQIVHLIEGFGLKTTTGG